MVVLRGGISKNVEILILVFFNLCSFEFGFLMYKIEMKIYYLI